MAANIAILVVAVAVLWTFFVKPDGSARSAKSDDIPAEPLSLDNLAIRGLREAQVGLIAFAEFECPYCFKFHEETFPSLQKDYFDTGKAFYAFRHLPLTTIHKRARRAAEAAECASLQNRFWAYHDVLFTKPMAIAEAQLKVKAVDLGLNSELFQTCLDSGRTASRIDFDSRLAERLGIRSTPAFLIGRVGPKGFQVYSKIRGAKPLAEFQRLLDAALAGG